MTTSGRWPGTSRAPPPGTPHGTCLRLPRMPSRMRSRSRCQSREVRLYPTLLELLADANPLQGNGSEGYWAMDVSFAGARKGEVTAAVAFATAQEGGAGRAAQRALAAIGHGHWTRIWMLAGAFGTACSGACRTPPASTCWASTTKGPTQCDPPHALQGVGVLARGFDPSDARGRIPLSAAGGYQAIAAPLDRSALHQRMGRRAGHAVLCLLRP